MSELKLEIDTTKISLETLKRLYRKFEKMQRFGGGYGNWLKLVEQAIEQHPENQKRAENSNQIETGS